MSSEVEKRKDDTRSSQQGRQTARCKNDKKQRRLVSRV